MTEDELSLFCADLEKKCPNGQFSRWDMEAIAPDLLALKDGDVYLEIGVDRGRSLWFARELTKDKDVSVGGVDIKRCPVIEGTTVWEMDSAKLGQEWQGKKVSLLFVDGDHSYDGCKADITAWLPHMRKHGMIFFHDCDETSPGVISAVEEFRQENKLEPIYFKTPFKNTSMVKVQL